MAMKDKCMLRGRDENIAKLPAPEFFCAPWTATSEVFCTSPFLAFHNSVSDQALEKDPLLFIMVMVSVLPSSLSPLYSSEFLYQIIALYTLISYTSVNYTLVKLEKEYLF